MQASSLTSSCFLVQPLFAVLWTRAPRLRQSSTCKAGSSSSRAILLALSEGFGEVDVGYLLDPPLTPDGSLSARDLSVLRGPVVLRSPQERGRGRSFHEDPAGKSVLAKFKHLLQDGLRRGFDGRTLERPCLHPEDKLRFGSWGLLRHLHA